MPTFDTAMLVITVGTLLGLPANLAYRVRGEHGRAVWSQIVALLRGQVRQLIAIV